MTNFTPPGSMEVPLSEIRTRVSVSGTRFKQTVIFKVQLPKFMSFLSFGRRNLPVALHPFKTVQRGLPETWALPRT